MTLRTVLRSNPVRRAIVDTLAPCRCRSRIMTISPSRITGSPLPEGKASATQRRPTAPDRRPTSGRLGNFQSALLGSFAAAPTAFDWIRTVAGQERTKFRGRERVGWAFTFAAAAYDLARL